MTKIHAEVLKLRNIAVQGVKVSSYAGQIDAAEKWKTRLLAYETVLGLLGDPEITPNWWKRLICKVVHVRHNSDCPVCGGWM